MATNVSVVELTDSGGSGLPIGCEGVAHLLAVAGHALAVHVALDVLAADDVLLDVGRRHRPQAVQHAGLGVADDVGAERPGRLHRHQAQHLEHVVLHHVAQRADALVVAGAAAESISPVVGSYWARPSSSATVICTWSMYLLFHSGSKMLLAKRSTSRFCTVSLPR